MAEITPVNNADTVAALMTLSLDAIMTRTCQGMITGWSPVAVILNLAVNARDAMPNGGSLTITTDSLMVDRVFAAEWSSVLPGPYVRITITDTGEGMPVRHRGRADPAEPLHPSGGVSGVG